MSDDYTRKTAAAEPSAADEARQEREEDEREAEMCPACVGRGILYWASPFGEPRNAWCDDCGGTGRRLS